MSAKDEQRDHHLERSTRLVVVAQIASQLISLLMIAWLYRLVGQESFGLIGMIGPWVLLLRMMTTQGVGVATIQDPRLRHAELNSLFWFNLLLGSLSTLLILASGWGLAWIYGAPPLVTLGMALCGTAFVASLSSQHLALLERDLRFRRATSVKLLAQILSSSSAVLTAWWLAEASPSTKLGPHAPPSGVWALVVQQYVELLLLGLGAWWLAPWRPTRPTGLKSIRHLVKFGGFYGAANVVFFLSRNIDKVTLSWLFGSTVEGRALIGMYSQAFNQMLKPVQLATTPLSSVLLPALSRVQSDRSSFESLTLRYLGWTTWVLAPASVGLMVVSEDAFALLGGDTWTFAGRLLMILSVAILAQGLINLCGSVYAAQGLAGRLLLGSISMFGLLLIVILSGVYVCHARGFAPDTTAETVAACFAIATLSAMPLYVSQCLKWTSVDRRQLVRRMAWPVLAALWMGAVTWMLRTILIRLELSSEVRLGVVILTGVLFYGWLTRSFLQRG